MGGTVISFTNLVARGHFSHIDSKLVCYHITGRQLLISLKKLKPQNQGLGKHYLILGKAIFPPILLKNCIFTQHQHKHEVGENFFIHPESGPRKTLICPWKGKFSLKLGQNCLCDLALAHK